MCVCFKSSYPVLALNKEQFLKSRAFYLGRKRQIVKNKEEFRKFV